MKFEDMKLNKNDDNVNDLMGSRKKLDMAIGDDVCNLLTFLSPTGRMAMLCSLVIFVAEERGVTTFALLNEVRQRIKEEH